MDYLVQLATDPAAWAAFVTLVVMEVVLGIDNLLFISILTNKLPAHQQQKGRRIGISLALVNTMLGLALAIVGQGAHDGVWNHLAALAAFTLIAVYWAGRRWQRL